MKAKNNISNRNVVVVLGLIVSILILCTSNHQFTSQEKTAADQGEESSEIPQLGVKSFDILNSSAHIELDHQFVLVREIVEESDEEIARDFKHQVQSHCIRGFQILFRLIISPNAP
ncbi:MAG: hypothetical protein RIC03_07410 [Cyclobacteriaceae bacterium]